MILSLSHLRQDTDYADGPAQESAVGKSLLSAYPQYTDALVVLHPFMEIKAGHARHLRLDHEDQWPTKGELGAHCTLLPWSGFLQRSGLRSHASLDRALAFYYSVVEEGEKSQCEKLWAQVESEPMQVIAPQPGEFSPLLEDKLLRFLQARGHTEVHLFTDAEALPALATTAELLANEEGLPPEVRLLTPDHAFMVVQPAEVPFALVLGQRTPLLALANALEAEGFFADEHTTMGWSHKEIPPNDRITWQELG